MVGVFTSDRTINCDVWTDYPLQTLEHKLTKHTHMVLIDNFEHNPKADFAINNGLLKKRQGEPKLTFSGIAIYRPEIFADNKVQPTSLLHALENAIDNGLVACEHYQGAWLDIGAQERLAVLNARMIKS